MRRRLVAAVLVAVAALAALAVPAAPAAAAAPVKRVLVISVPYLTWTDLGGEASPALDALLERSAVGNLAVRAVRRRTTLGDGYATIGAGTRAGAPRRLDGLALEPHESFEGGTAGEAFERRLGRPLDGAVGLLSLPALREANARLLFGAEIGALGAALEAAGVAPAVIGNADTSRTSGEQTSYHRMAVIALMGPGGELAAGRVDRTLLRDDPDAPYGLRLDIAAVTGAFGEVWHDGSVVLVEASDLARAEHYADRAAPARRDDLVRAALGWTDELVGSLLGRVDPDEHAVLVVSPAVPLGETRLTVAALAAPGVGPGLLRSASTRRSGFAVIADVGPTILDLMGVDRPSSMEGRPMGFGRGGGTPADRRAFLIDAEDDARFRDMLVGPVALGFVVAQVALSGVAVGVLRWERRGRGRAAVELASLALLGFLPLTYLAALLPFSDWGVGPYLGFVAGGALVLAFVARALDRGRRDLLPVAALLGLIVAVIVGSTVNGSRLSLSTVFGDSPLVAWRFSGIGNLTYAQLATAALLLAGFVAHKVAGRRGVWAAIALLGAVLVVDGLPAWGSDVGGVLASVPAFGLVGILLLGWRFRWRLLGAAVVATGLAVTGFVVFDLSRPSGRRTHLGRLYEQVDVEGLGAFTRVVERKLDANLSVLTGSVWTLLVPAVLAFLAYLVYRSPSALGAIQRRLPELRVALSGILVAGVLGFALNDSGIAVPGMMLGVLNPVLVYLSARWT